MTFLYFSYGSNMLTERLTARCPSAQPVGVAYAEGHSLEFSKPSVDDSGKGTLVPVRGARAYGVIFRIEDDERAALDRAEGNRRGYERDDGFRVRRVGVDEELVCSTYLASRRDPAFRPYDWYLALVVAGARQHELPEGEIDRLRNTPFDEDSVPDRATRKDAIAALAAAGFGSPEDVLRG